MNSKSAKFFIRKHWLLALVGPLLLCFVAPQQSAAKTAYTVTDVGPVNDLNDTVAGAAGINNHGLVVGQASLPAGTDRAFLWIRGSIFDLRTLGGPESDSHAAHNQFGRRQDRLHRRSSNSPAHRLATPVADLGEGQSAEAQVGL
jgi:probable HAF family extracellular repeat protein